MRARVVHGLARADLSCLEVGVHVFLSVTTTIADQHVWDAQRIDVRTAHAKHPGKLGCREKRNCLDPFAVVTLCVVVRPHASTLPGASKNEGGDKEVLRNEEWKTLTRKERAVAIDSYVVSCAARVLGTDSCFFDLVGQVREAIGDPELADRLASRYVRFGPGRDAIALMLRVAASSEPRTIQTALANMGAVGVWADVDLDLPQDAQRDRDRSRYRRGMELIAARGGRRCLACGKENVRGCCSYAEAPQSIRDSDRETIKVTRGALAEALGFSSSAGPRARRTASNARP